LKGFDSLVERLYEKTKWDIDELTLLNLSFSWFDFEGLTEETKQLRQDCVDRVGLVCIFFLFQNKRHILPHFLQPHLRKREKIKS